MCIRDRGAVHVYEGVPPVATLRHGVPFLYVSFIRDQKQPAENSTTPTGLHLCYELQPQIYGIHAHISRQVGMLTDMRSPRAARLR